MYGSTFFATCTLLANFYFILLYASTPPHYREKYCTFFTAIPTSYFADFIYKTNDNFITYFNTVKGSILHKEYLLSILL